MLSLNNHSGKFIGVVALALVAVALLFNLLMHKFFITEKGPKVSCAAFFLVQSDLQTRGVMSLHIDGVSHGRMHISATVRDSAGAVKYNLLRNVNFDYRYEGNGHLALQLVDVNKNASDTMPNELFNQSIFDFSVKARQLRITEVGDGYLLWNDFSPVMMCIHNP
ncbi:MULTISPECIES: hypothetical protein [Serratia]|uniref:hypothetical protein n=1 Tax=Serratia TaxID=613 RepID=UPI000BA226D7|nr:MULTISPECIES: hypothetical protein [Serratia]PAA97331.1 hypothetical protein CJJ13_10795 [Serratia fonticola]QXN63170.1 hypothetical protein J8M99_03675 [Serratia fonticola]RDL14341.1 FidL-like putative membrane protein [Serratia fonticola]UAN52426.1 hypothetical protein KGP26_04920 [Serratia sp. JSRIV002]UAN58557.1 hypothetical protein KGP21_05685 [Serratia sp. JSRIV004]